MFNSFVLTLALRYFKAKKNETFISVISVFSLLGVAIGVAALIVVMSVMNGFRNELTRNIIGLNGDITVKPVERIIDNYDEIKIKLSSKDYIAQIVPSISGQALALGPKNNCGVLITGIDLGDLKHKNEILKNVNFGDFANFFGKSVIAVGSELANNLGVRIGDKVKLISPNSISTAFGSMPRSKEFKVIAIFTSGVYDYDAAKILMPLEAAMNFLSFDNGINLIEIYLKPTAEALITSREIRNILGGNFRVTSWVESHAQFLNALDVERVAMFTILSLIILVAAFNIISSLFMLVKDKTKDIAILKTIGASQKQIMLVFICNGLLIGIIGTVIGVLLGVGFAQNIENIRKYLEQITGTKIFEAAIYFLYTLPSEVRIGDIAIVSLVTILLCFCSTIYPAYKASKLNPIDGLRYE
jgi:lipoprotein-releasing system permease protein